MVPAAPQSVAKELYLAAIFSLGMTVPSDGRPPDADRGGPPASSPWAATAAPQQPPTEFRRITRALKRHRNETVTFTGTNRTPRFEFSGGSKARSTNYSDKLEVCTVQLCRLCLQGCWKRLLGWIPQMDPRSFGPSPKVSPNPKSS